MVISDFVRETAKKLDDNARFEAEQMVMSALKITKTQLVLQGHNEIYESDMNSVNEMVKRRKNGEPLQYIIGECGFMSLDFYVEKGVLIPRSDTETLVETIIEKARENAEIIDICTGSGCIGISLAHFIGGSNIRMIDISDTAVYAAEKNIMRHGMYDRVKVQKLDILNECPDGKYDVVVSNPPYVETDVIKTLQTEVRDFEPHLALDGGSDGLAFYRRITDIAPEILNDKGILAFEIGFNQGDAVKSLMERDFRDVEIKKDLCGNDRVVTGILK